MSSRTENLIPFLLEGRGLIILKNRCSECNHDSIPPEANYCPNCGTVLPGSNTEEARSDPTPPGMTQGDPHNLNQVINQLDEIAVWMGNQDGFYYLSPGFEAIWGIPLEELYDDFSKLIDTVHPEDRELVVRSIQDTSLYEHGDPHVFEHRIVRPDGAVRWLEVRILPIDNPDSTLPEVAGVSIDITERKRTEQKLETERAFIQQSLDALDDLFYVISPDGKLLKWNRKARQVTGYSDEELAAKDLLEFSPEDEQERIRQAFLEAYETGSARVEGNLITAEGESIPYEFSGSPLTDGEGTIRGIIGIGRDISERLKTERELVEARNSLEQKNKWLELALSAGKIGVWEWDVEENRQHHDERVTEIFQRSVKTLREFLQAVHPEDRDRVERQSREALEGEEYRTRYRIIAGKDGGIRWVESRARALRDESGEPVRLIGTVRDITEQHQKEDQLKYQRSLLNSVVEASIEGILVVDEERDVVTCNQRFLDLWSIPPDLDSASDQALLDRALGKLKDPEEFIDRVEYLYEHPEKESREEIELEDGRIFDRYSSPVRANDGTHFGRVWFFRDVTEQREHQKQLEESNRDKDRLMQEIHHRVKNNFQLASSMLGLQRRATDIEEVKQILDDIRGRIQSMVTLHRILYQQDDVERVQMKSYLEAIINALGENFQSNDDSITLDQTLSDVSLSPERALHVGLILTELVMNSFQHAMSDTDEGKIFVRFKESNGFLILTVADNGPGFDDDLDTLTSDSLGLKLVRALAVDQLGGSFSADGSDGARFEIRIPLKKQTERRETDRNQM